MKHTSFPKYPMRKEREQSSQKKPKLRKDEKWLLYVSEIRVKFQNKIDKLQKESASLQSRKDILEEWLRELVDNLKQGNTIDNDSLANEINELLDYPCQTCGKYIIDCQCGMLSV